jgi:hypothetical protein
VEKPTIEGDSPVRERDLPPARHLSTAGHANLLLLTVLTLVIQKTQKLCGSLDKLVMVSKKLV